MDDQSETLILSLKRGSGPNGLSAMSIETTFGKTKIIRPLLGKQKKELELWAICNNLSWVEDSSNLNTVHDRNFIRNKILPVLEKRWPYFVKNCFRTAKICNEETKLINILLKEKIKNFINSDYSLNITSLKKITKEICIGLIRHWMVFKNKQTASYNMIQCIYREIIFNDNNENPKIILKTHEIRCYKRSLYFIKKQKNIKNKFLFWHNSDIKLTLPNNLGCLIKNDQGISFPAPKKNELINIRFQHEGKVLILGRDQRQKIKKIWQEKNIPSWLRNQIPLLFYDNNLISALGVFTVNINSENRRIWKISWISNLTLNNNNNSLTLNEKYTHK